MKLHKWLKSLTVAASLGLGIAQAAVVFQLDANGELTGAQGVLVGGQLYDVSFAEGTCYALFDLCTNTTNFVFSTEASAHAASDALLSQVFVGAYDSDSTLLAAIPNGTFYAVAITPYAMGSGATSGRVLVSFAQNGPSEGDDYAFESSIGTTTDTRTGTADVFAVWSPSTLTPSPPLPGGGGSAPEPGSLALVGASLGLLVMARRRRR